MNKKELIEELKNLGLNDEVLSGIKDDQLEVMVEKLTPKKLEFDDFLKDTKNQSEFDRRVTKAIDKVKKKIKPSDEEEVETDEIKGDVPEWAKALLDTNKRLTQEIEGIKKGTVAQSKMEKAKSILSKTKIPDEFKEKWINRIDVNSETTVEDQIDGLTKEYDSLVQVIADNKHLGGTPPTGSQEKPGMSKEELKKALI